MSGLLSHLLLNSVSAASKLDPKLESALKSHEVRAVAVETAIQYHEVEAASIVNGVQMRSSNLK